MKTIQIRSSNQDIYTINVKHITHFINTDKDKGTYIYLSNNNSVYTPLALSFILDMIKRCGEVDSED